LISVFLPLRFFFVVVASTPWCPRIEEEFRDRTPWSCGWGRLRRCGGSRVELWPVVNIGFDEASLFFFSGVVIGITGVRGDRVVVIIAPFCEMVCELETRCVGGGVFKVDDNKLFVGVGWVEEGRFDRRFEAEDIAVLCLDSFSSRIHRSRYEYLHHYEQRPAAS
jgi:hypothetical protein